MATVVPDRAFGNGGTLWSGVALRYVDTYLAEEETHYVGGTAVGMHLTSNGKPTLVVTGWTFVRPWSQRPSYEHVRLVQFPPDGAPQEWLRWDGTVITDLSANDRHAEVLANCSRSAGDVAVLIRQGAVNAGPGPWTYAVAIEGGAVSDRQAVLPAWLFDTLGQPQPGSVRMAPDGTDLGIASCAGTLVRITRLRAAGTTPRDVDLAGTSSLPGLLRLEVASVRFTTGWASVALTAYLNHPGVGPTSVGVILRVLADGSRDINFGDNGVWASPLSLNSRDFVCAGESVSGLAGVIGRRAVMFAIEANGSGPDLTFGDGGMAERDLGGPLASPVTASDATATYVFAQRVPTQADHAGDLRTVGCRFEWSPFSASHGIVDASFGGGTVTLHCDEAPVTPAGVVLANGLLYLAGTRQLHGADCDRIPVVVALAADGAPALGFGAGGCALQGSVKAPALVAPDGAAVFLERSTGSTEPALRFLTASGALGALVALTSIPANSVISGLTRLADGNLIVAGGGADAWVVKLDAAGAPVAAFGTGGVQEIRPGTGQGTARVLGERANGDIALLVDGGAQPQLALMHPDGQLDTSYGNTGFVDVESYTHPGAGPNGARCFLDADGSVILVVSSEHEPASFTSGPVRVALRRVTAAGAYDPNFGLGALSVNPPAAGRSYTVYYPVGGSGGNDDFKSISPTGIAWLGGRLYVLATAWSGGKWISTPGFNKVLPSYPLLMLLAWTSDGAVDTSFAGSGKQEAGYDPDRKYWAAAGILQDTPTSFYAYGSAAEVDVEMHSVGGGTPYPVNITRQPQPALFRVEHPGGLDLAFGGDGAATMRLQEVLLTPAAGALTAGGRIRLACVDYLTQTDPGEPRTNQAAMVAWRPGKQRIPGRHPIL